MKARDFMIPICDALGEAAAIADMKAEQAEQPELEMEIETTVFENPAWHAAWLRGYERGKRRAKWR